MVFEPARRQVELAKDVVIVLDSLTRLARSHNTTGRSSGRTRSGGLDANALAKPKALFGAARAVPNGGRLPRPVPGRLTAAGGQGDAPGGFPSRADERQHRGPRARCERLRRSGG